MNTMAPRPRLRVEPVGHCLLVSVGAVHLRSQSIARSLPAEAGRLAVVLPDAALAADPELAGRLREWVPMGYESVRLVAAGAAAPGQWQPPAQALCDMLDAEVIAPDGDLVAAPGGSLFVRPGPDGSPRAWWRFRPGRDPQRGGCRFPVPEWERALTEFDDAGLAGLAVEQLPAGLWIHRAGRHASPPDDLAYAIAAQPDTVVLLISRPGDEPLRAAELRQVIATTPESLRDRLVVVPYGDRPVADAPLGAVVSLALNRTLRVNTGLPLELTGRGHQVTAIGSDGEPAWLPFAREVSWRPHAGSRILSCTTPAARLLPAGMAQYLLNERWVVEVVEAGLWIREVDRTEGANLVRELPLDSRHCTVVIGAADVDQKAPPWRAVRRLLRSLPPAARNRLTLAVPAGAGDWFASSVSRACRKILRGRPVAVLTATGAVSEGGRTAPGGRRSTRPADAQRSTWRTETERASHRVGRDLRMRETPAPRRRSSASPTTEDDLSTLLGFVDQIRRTPAWDELPDDHEPAASPLDVAPRSRVASPRIDPWARASASAGQCAAARPDPDASPPTQA